MSAGLDVFRVIAPEFSATADGTVENYIEVAARRHSATAFGNVYADAMAHYAAHMMTMNDPSGTGGMAGTAGPVTARKAGGVSESYGSLASIAASEPGDAGFAATYHGRQYLHLRNTRAASAPTHCAP